MSSADVSPPGQPGVSQWLKLARAAASTPPASARAELRLGAAEKVIGSIDPVLAARMSVAGLALRRHGAAWVVEGAADASLAAIARWLHQERICTHWRDELLPVVDGDGHSLAVVERSVVRVLGLKTFAVHLAGRSPDAGAWVQRRAFDKATDPGRWDTLMGGQVTAGETTQATLERETMEEAGLAMTDLQALERCPDISVCRPVDEGYMVEHIAVFRAVVPEGRVPENRDGEVERFECLHQDALLERLCAGLFTLEATLILGAELERRDEAPSS